MHHVIWVEHDGSWTWSIEEGKAFEDSHKVLARDDGFPTRGDAKEDMQKAWNKLLKQGKRPGRLTDLTKTKDTKKTARKSSSSASESATTRLSSIPQWGVFSDGKLVALFVTQSDAQAYAKQPAQKGAKVHRTVLGVSSDVG